MYIINNDEYYNFIDNNDYLTSCQKKIFKFFRKNNGNIYINVESNKQTYTFIYNAFKEENFVKISKITLLLKKFISYRDSVKLINLIKQNKMLDTQIIEWINKNKNLNKSLDGGKYDIYQICSSWKYIFENLTLSCNSLFKKFNINIKDIKYLDIGCGSGYKTIKFSNSLELKKKNVNGTDLKHWGPYNQAETSYDFNFKFILENGKLDYPDNSFDFISCLLMLHHVNDLEFLIKEIKRILKPNGILLIIEHDCHDDYDKLILNILHTFYGFLVDKDENTISNPSYSQYFNWCEWDFIFHKNKFSFIKSNYVFTNIEHDSRFDNIYYCFFLNEK
jgi:ubiquinone/menaquinone biosynthesis C-methylase UbiE